MTIATAADGRGLISSGSNHRPALGCTPKTRKNAPDTRPTRADIFGSIELDYKLILNLFGLAAFAALFYLTARRGATDPVCGMKVDRSKALRAVRAGRTYFFCSEDCRAQFEADPEAYTQPRPAAVAHAAGQAH